jgi:hypothetical protein
MSFAEGAVLFWVAVLCQPDANQQWRPAHTCKVAITLCVFASADKETLIRSVLCSIIAV